jgi:biopolymer transport protein ExbD
MLRKRVNISRRKPVDEPEIIVIPMIDVMMFLLFFFIVASLAMVVQSGLAVNLPKASQSTQHSTQNLTVTIMKDNRVFLNLKPVQVAELASGLEKLKVSPDSLVIINADAAVSHGLVVSVMNEVTKAGITHFTFATDKSAGGA